MSKGRLEAFSDGVIAILITIMVLELKVPHGASLTDLEPLGPVFFSYILSFVVLGTYWNNHHHLLQASRVVGGRVLWANLHLLFWLSLFPFITAWMGENAFAPVPTAIYGAVMALAAMAFYVLIRTLVGVPGQSEALGVAMRRDWKGRVSMIAFAIMAPVALVAPLLSLGVYIAVTALWFVPDRRMERAHGEAGRG
ncbi:MAG: putative rane protein [Chloroflexi bacterium]|nr:putative rane protein [Chloroflexota bacterium]